VSGFTIVAEKLNYLRYIAHFRSVHRGQFFTTMKTTAVRKLLPDSWGFMCPVHTPDGSPCGLLNHLAAACVPMCYPIDASRVESAMASVGMAVGAQGYYDAAAAAGRACKAAGEDTCVGAPLPVFLDGRLVGAVPAAKARKATRALRALKRDRSDARVPESLEMVLIERLDGGGGPAAGLFLHAAPGRMIRPVACLEKKKVAGKGGEGEKLVDEVELIGPMEQTFMDIAAIPEDVHSGTEYRELHPTMMLSVVASLTPFSDYNQSPRNM
jgi:DNA-directed RNA polymerase I subunit RPA2